MPTQEVFVGNWADAALLNNILEAEGILTVVAAARVQPRRLRALFVIDPDQMDRARDIVQRFLEGEPLEDPRSYRSWRCRTCDELIEGQFQNCWNCGGAKPA